jgi:hypothetical protein
MDGEDLEEEVVARMLDGKCYDPAKPEYGNRPSDSDLVRNARRDIFNIIQPRQKDNCWYGYPDVGSVY